MKVIFWLAMLSFLLYSCNTSSHFTGNNNCDTTTLHYDNKNNDTTRLVFIKGAVFDTLPCLLNATLIDRTKKIPIQNAIIHLQGNDSLYNFISDINGSFSIFNTKLCVAKNWTLSIIHKDYYCMKVIYSQFTGGQWIEIKLKSK